MLTKSFQKKRESPFPSLCYAIEHRLQEILWIQLWRIFLIILIKGGICFAKNLEYILHYNLKLILSNKEKVHFDKEDVSTFFKVINICFP